MIVQRQVGENPWRSQYRFTLTPRQMRDFASRCQYQQTSPDSHFTRQRICTLPTQDGRITLADLKFIRTARAGLAKSAMRRRKRISSRSSRNPSECNCDHRALPQPPSSARLSGSSVVALPPHRFSPKSPRKSSTTISRPMSATGTSADLFWWRAGAASSSASRTGWRIMSGTFRTRKTRSSTSPRSPRRSRRPRSSSRAAR